LTRQDGKYQISLFDVEKMEWTPVSLSDCWQEVLADFVGRFGK
jgi:hypothetical protein